MLENPAPRNSKRTSAKKNPLLKKTTRIERLSIRNFKAFDEFDIDFPPPFSEDDPDILVIGSKNGLGKTSVLEACLILFLVGIAGEDHFSLSRYVDSDLRLFLEVPIDLPDLMVRAGAKEARIEGTFLINNVFTNLSLRIMRDGHINIEGDKSAFQALTKMESINPPRTRTREMVRRLTLMLAGLNSDPLISPPLMYFHSYRKVQEGNLELGMMVEGERLRRYRSRSGLEVPISTFKLEVLRSLMSRGGLFENLDNIEADDVLNRLNDLMKQFAGGSIEKLRPSPDNTIEFRVSPSNGGQSFTFDGLSSGQKEIISTLFLIWRYTQGQTGIVLIDEPELHLNAEWHRSFIRYLTQLAPNNQYIIASHSEDVFAAVDKDRRILLNLDMEDA